MGINAEQVEILGQLRAARLLEGFVSVVELGAQDVCAPPEAVRAVLQRHGLDAPVGTLNKAAGIYAPFGFVRYVAIDATSQHGSLPYDLNHDLAAVCGFTEKFDLVTNLGTGEHVFDQRALFANMHALCRVGGLMIQCLPAQGLVNHAFYNYHPKFLADLASANRYEIVSVAFTRDFKPELFPYTLTSFRAHDSGDVMVYGVLRRTSDAPFRLPFDAIFKSVNQLEGYDTDAVPSPVPPEEFRAYIKTTWANATLRRDAAAAPDLAKVSTKALQDELARRQAKD